MTHMRLKLSVAGLVLACAVGYLGFAGVQRGWVYTLSVDQFIANTSQQNQRVRLCGNVGAENIEIHKAQLSARFVLKGEHGAVAVAYSGVVPDMFKGGAEVVVEGQRDAGGVFQADVLMTKCASKYEGKPAGHPSVSQQGDQR